MKLYRVKLRTKMFFRVILNLSMFSKVICNQFTEDTYLPCVVRTVPGFCSLTNKAQLEICLGIYKAQEMLYLC